MDTIGERIVKLRSDSGLDQATLAFHCGWEKQRLYNYEKNKRDPKVSELTIIADALEPYLGANLIVYLVTGKFIEELKGAESVRTQKFSPEDAVNELKETLLNATEFGLLKLKPGFKLSDIVESFSKKVGKYYQASGDQTKSA